MEDNYSNKLDYLPGEIIDCLSTKETPPRIHPESLLPKNKKRSVKNEKTSNFSNYFDITSIRGKEMDKLNIVEKKTSVESIIPKMYWMVKEDMLRFLQYTDRELQCFEDSDKRQIIFPTEFPISRHEVKCLEETLQRILEDYGRPDIDFLNFRLTSRKDIDELIQCIIPQEEIYNIILHELGRQVMTSSYEGGCTILELRDRYSELMAKIPEELIRLKDEVKEQVIKDSKLLSQIDNFQTGIVYLTDHLKDVKNKDIKITKNAESLQKELEAAMQDSVRSKELLNDYHGLYDLQRQRLDNQMSSINIEKEEWSSLAFALALKISDESLLNTTKRLRLISKKLIQQSQHFVIFISDCDTVITSKIQDLSDKFLKVLTLLHTKTNKIMNNFFDLYHFLKNKFESFTKREIKEPKDQNKEVLNQILALKGFLNEEVLKRFMVEISSESTSTYEAQVISMNTFVEELKTLIYELSERSRFISDQTEETAQSTHLDHMFENIKEWSELIFSNLNIISTFQDFFMDFQSKVILIETEVRKFTNVSDVNEENEKINFEGVIILIDDLYIETFENQELDQIVKNEDFTNFTQFYDDILKKMTQFSYVIDGFDASMMEDINTHQDKITHWIVDILFLLSNMTESNDLDVKYKTICENFEELIVFNSRMFEYITKWTAKLMISSSSDQDSRELEIEEYKDENTQWSDVAEILVRNIGDKIEQEFLKRKKQSEILKKNISLENVEGIIQEIAARCKDNNIYLSIKSVQNLKSELDEVQKRIITAKENKDKLGTYLLETENKIKEYESKLAELTVEYRGFTKI